MLFLTIAVCILLLILLISWLKCNTFIAFIIVSLAGGLMLGMPLEKIPGSIQKGVGDTLGSLLMVILFGAMIGKLVAESGAAQKNQRRIVENLRRKTNHMGVGINRIYCRNSTFL